MPWGTFTREGKERAAYYRPAAKPHILPHSLSKTSKTPEKAAIIYHGAVMVYLSALLLQHVRFILCYVLTLYYSHYI